MGFFLGYVVGFAVAFALMVGFAKYQILRSKRRIDLVYLYIYISIAILHCIALHAFDLHEFNYDIYFLHILCMRMFYEN